MPRTRTDGAPDSAGRAVDRGPLCRARRAHRLVEESTSTPTPRRCSAGRPTTAARARHWRRRRLRPDRGPLPDREEVLGAGDAYVLTPGHLTLVSAGSEVVEFSPPRRCAPRRPSSRAARRGPLVGATEPCAYVACRPSDTELNPTASAAAGGSPNCSVGMSARSLKDYIGGSAVGLLNLPFVRTHLRVARPGRGR
jgi:hypothetical protein